MHWTWNWGQRRLMKRVEVEVEAERAGQRRPAPWRKTGVVAVAMALSSGTWNGWDRSGFLLSGLGAIS